MAWITPKTDWQREDPFDLSPDYERIRGNLLYLRDWADRLGDAPALPALGEYAIQDVPDPDFFNHVEQASAALAGHLAARRVMSRTLEANGGIWDADDLNRIEEMALTAYQDFASAEVNRPRLAFVLGGGMFGSYL